MIKQLKQVQEWTEAFGVYFQTTPAAKLPYPVQHLRVMLMTDEIKEYQTALAGFDNQLKIANNDEQLKCIAKELADILYTVYGTITAHGLNDVMEQVFDEVHRSNMSKLDSTGKPVMNEFGKVLKPANYSPADLSFLIKK